MRCTDTGNLRQELQEARAHIARLEGSLVESQRMATVGQLACRMAHEFNNVLMLILGRATQALKYGDAELKEEALRKIVESGQRAADIILSLKDYMAGRQTQSQVIAAEALMEAAVNLIAWDLPKSGIQVVRQYESKALVRIVPGRLEQVLLNLILNARTAMKQRGGRLTALVADAETPGYVAFRIQDTGCGIPEEHLDKIFDPFFTTRPRSNGNDDCGTGLGLPVARDLVHQAGGEIDVESTPGVGSTFTVLLPIARDNE